MPSDLPGYGGPAEAALSTSETPNVHHDIPRRTVGRVRLRHGQTLPIANVTGEPPNEMRNVLLWRVARENQFRHDCLPAEAGAPLCGFCGARWPCDPRLNADEALAASYTAPR